MLEDYVSIISNISKEDVNTLFSIDFCYVGVAYQDFSDIWKLCTQEKLKLEPFGFKPARCRVRRGDFVENLNAYATQGFLQRPTQKICWYAKPNPPPPLLS